MTSNTSGAWELEALVHRLQRGDEDAFSAILEPVPDLDFDQSLPEWSGSDGSRRGPEHHAHELQGHSTA